MCTSESRLPWARIPSTLPTSNQPQSTFRTDYKLQKSRKIKTERLKHDRRPDVIRISSEPVAARQRQLSRVMYKLVLEGIESGVIAVVMTMYAWSTFT